MGKVSPEVFVLADFKLGLKPEKTSHFVNDVLI